jgi:hypothetical protein
MPIAIPGTKADINNTEVMEILVNSVIQVILLTLVVMVPAIGGVALVNANNLPIVLAVVALLSWSLYKFLKTSKWLSGKEFIAVLVRGFFWIILVFLFQGCMVSVPADMALLFRLASLSVVANAIGELADHVLGLG